MWFNRILTFLALPAAFLLLQLLIGDNLFLVWLIFAGLYIILLSAPAIANRPSKGKISKAPQLVMRLVGSIVWAGFLAVAYVFLYSIVFDRENFFPQ